MKKKGKTLITGAAGFIGSHLVDLLLKEGEPPNKLRLFVKTGESLDNLPSNKNFDIIVGDIRDKKLIKKAMKDVEVVYHLAARIDFDGKDYADYKDVNVDATQHLLDECKNKRIKKFIFFSSIGVYGLPAGIGDIISWDEEHIKVPTNHYGRSKLEAEQAVIMAHSDWGMPYTIIRPASVYGPREKGPTLALYRAINKRQFVMIGKGNNKMHYVYVTDLVKAARLAEKSKQRTGNYIIAGEEPAKFKNIVKWISKSINQSVPKIVIPGWLALMISYPINIMGKITGIKVPLFPSRVKTMTTSYYYDITKAKEELRYSPKINFKKGAYLTGRWYLKKGWLGL